MVRPNQIISSDVSKGDITFIIFAQSPKQASRRILFLNFPGKYVRMKINKNNPQNSVKSVKELTSGMVNRYAVTVDVNSLTS